jgi:hypothetical protein
MRTSWTRERIIRHILEREAQGRPLTTGGKGFDHRLYCAARRNFGSWRNALLAAGIAPERVLVSERWSPARILTKIRHISRRRRPLTTDQMERRYCNLVSAARRHFGSWSKAVLAAGVDPSRLQRVVRWNRERVIEAILTRALRNESLVARLVEPRSLVEAAQRFLGDWPAAVAAAGLDPKVTELPPRRGKRSHPRTPRAGKAGSSGGPSARWSKERVVEAILARLHERRPINAAAVCRDHPTLYGAAQRHLRGWDAAMRAAGLDPNKHRRRGAATRLVTAPGAVAPGAAQSHGDDVVRPNRGV